MPSSECTSAVCPDQELLLEEEQIVLARGDRSYRVRGLERNMSTLQLTVNILARRLDLVYLDTVDLVKARARQFFIKAAAGELYVEEEVIKKDIGQLLLHLEDLQRRQIEAARQPRNSAPAMTDQERDEALALLRDPHLLDRIVNDMSLCGMVGERTNKLVGYLAATSRKLPRPLAALVQSSSSAGKSALMDAILGMMPAEEQLRCSGLTGQSLYYLQGRQIGHKILAISEEAGIGEAAYALKLLQSEGELRHLCVGKDAGGRMQAQEYHVQGPVQLLMTTTSLDIDEELLNRCLVLTVDEGREQTAAIHAEQRLAETASDVAAERRQHKQHKLRGLHQNAQRLLRPLQVYNPYAPQLTFPSNNTRLRRDHVKYLTLIKTVAFLQQYQRKVYSEEIEGEPIEYIQVAPHDIEVANTLCAEVLGRTLDELSPQTRRFLILLHEYVKDACHKQPIERRQFRFSRRDVRAALDWTDFQVRMHLAKLVDYEYVLVHRGRRGRQFVYELLYDGQGQAGESFLVGLLQPGQIRQLKLDNPKV